MNVRHLFGKPLPLALQPTRLDARRSWVVTLALFAVAAVTAWVVKALLAKDAQETEDMVYFWPD